MQQKVSDGERSSTARRSVVVTSVMVSGPLQRDVLSRAPFTRPSESAAIGLVRMLIFSCSEHLVFKCC